MKSSMSCNEIYGKNLQRIMRLRRIHMLQIAVCDDNIDELSNMVQHLDKYRISRNLSCEYAAFINGFDLITVLEKGKQFDIYLLDIIIPGFDGLETAKAIVR
jgi:CheY-like chemotaxis protein